MSAYDQACNYTTGFNYMCIFIVYVNLLLQTNWKPLLTRERGLQSSWVHHVSVSTLVRPSWSKTLRTEAQASIPSSSGSRRQRKRPRLPLPPLLSISRPWWAKSTGRSRAITWKHVCRAPRHAAHKVPAQEPALYSAVYTVHKDLICTSVSSQWLLFCFSKLTNVRNPAFIIDYWTGLLDTGLGAHGVRGQ